jgi:hypothetical protein
LVLAGGWFVEVLAVEAASATVADIVWAFAPVEMEVGVGA